MNDQQHLYSKVLIHEHSEEALATIKEFCDNNKLMGLRDKSNDILDIVQEKVDLGAIFLALENNDFEQSFALARLINHYQHQVPVFLRLPEDSEVPEELTSDYKELFAGSFKLSDLDALKELVDSYVFCMHYPNALVQGFREISNEALTSAFKDSELVMGHPCVVKDQTIYGEVLSLIELESSFCRGYMMLQVDKSGILDAITKGRTALTDDDANERGINTMISEVTNLIWGRIKARFFKEQHDRPLYRVQVPIVINHTDKYVTFGSDQPQLCIEYNLRDKNNHESFIKIIQRFIFNIDWAPERFSESEQAIDDLVEAGELEMF
ncbi:MAG: chemotaxis protein CheX [Pseudomonadales bacterium]|nr:chemotaxis protein CheX [Pseudomonadales bacterium]